MESKPVVFCTAPWMHLHITSDGYLSPCCISKLRVNGEGGVAHMWNSPAMRQLRLDLQAGTVPDSCSACTTSRNSATCYAEEHNRYAGDDLFSILAPTDADGNAPFRPITFDVRTSTCNLACRTCGPGNSTRIYSVQRAHNIIYKFGPLTPQDIDEDLTDSVLKSAKYMYWAGGEPLVSRRTWATLDRLIEMGKTDVRLRFNTNFANLAPVWEDKLRGVLSTFKDVRMAVSLDGHGEYNNYVRYGSDYTEVVTRLAKFKDEFPHVEFNVDTTMTPFGILSLPELLVDAEGIGVRTLLKSARVKNNRSFLDVNMLTRNTLVEQLALARDVLERQGDRRKTSLGYFDAYAKLVTAQHTPMFVTEEVRKHIAAMEALFPPTSSFFDLIPERALNML